MSAKAVITALPAIIKKQEREKALVEYVTEGIRMISRNTAICEGDGYLNISYEDLFKPVDTRTGEEIAADVISRAGLKAKNECI